VATNADGWAVATIDRILAGRSDLKDDTGKDVFFDKLLTLKHLSLPAAALYADLLTQVFHAAAPAGLHLANLRNAPGEIGVRTGNSDTYFAVINIGDDANFMRMAEEAQLGLATESEAIRDSLFGVINAPSSPVTLLIGAKKFTEGWNSWRVSAMGLLNVGRSEGSEIIQMFGRGVRLKGRDFSLKRSAESDTGRPRYIDMLETLNIFSINGDYLAEFKKMLEREGIVEGYDEIALPIQYSLFDAKQPKLLTLRLKHDLRFDHPKIQLYRMLQEIADNLGDPLDLVHGLVEFRARRDHDGSSSNGSRALCSPARRCSCGLYCGHRTRRAHAPR